MASSAQQGFVDPYNFVDQGAQNNADLARMGMNSHGFLGRLGDMFGMGVSQKEERNLLNDDRAYERASIDSARAWSEYMDNTAVQRRVEDMKAAGLNPWLAVQNGISGSGAATVDTGGSAQHQRKSDQSKSGLAMLLLALSKIIG